MAVRLEKAGNSHEVHDQISEVVNLYYAELLDLNVQVGVAFAYSESDTEGEPKPAVTWNKMPVVAKVEKTAYEKRVWGYPDAVLTIDGAQWKGLADDRQLALLDELLAYLEVSSDEDGRPRSDDLGRPVLKVGLPDFCLMGHTRVLERRGEAALSAQAFAKTLADHPKLKQLLLDFAAPGVESGYGVGRN